MAIFVRESSANPTKCAKRSDINAIQAYRADKGIPGRRGQNWQAILA